MAVGAAYERLRAGAAGRVGTRPSVVLLLLQVPAETPSATFRTSSSINSIPLALRLHQGSAQRPGCKAPPGFLPENPNVPLFRCRRRVHPVYVVPEVLVPFKHAGYPRYIALSALSSKAALMCCRFAAAGAVHPVRAHPGGAAALQLRRLPRAVRHRTATQNLSFRCRRRSASCLHGTRRCWRPSSTPATPCCWTPSRCPRPRRMAAAAATAAAAISWAPSAPRSCRWGLSSSWTLGNGHVWPWGCPAAVQ